MSSVPARARGQGPAQYVGTVTNEGVPGQPAELRLNIYSRTDTSFSGYMDIGLPLAGSGPLYGWYRGDSVHLVTVSTTGDTILWHAPHRRTLHGQYQILGGPYRGQSGYWSATLQRGAALGTPAARAGVPATDGSTMVGWLLVLVAFGGLALGIRWALTGSPVERIPGYAHQRTRQEEELTGVGGWMAWFILGQVVTIIWGLARARSLWAPFTNGLWTIGGIVPTMQPLLAAETGTQLLQIALPILGLWLTMRTDHRAPRFWFVYLMATVVYGVLDIAAASLLVSEMTNVLGSSVGQGITGAIAQTESTNARLAFFGFVWAMYWAHSRRVRLTFGRAAFGVPADGFRVPEALAPDQERDVLPHMDVARTGPEAEVGEIVRSAAIGEPAESAAETAVASSMLAIPLPEAPRPIQSRVRHERPCPYCAEAILASARYCKHCHRDVEPLGPLG